MPSTLIGRTPAPIPSDPWLTLKEASAEVKLSPQTLRTAIARGRLRVARVNDGRNLRIRRSWLETWLEGGNGDPRF